MAPLALVTIHHEGAGTPTDEPRGAAGGYTYWVGPTASTRLRSPYQSYATLHYNHVSVDICLSGNRDLHPITDHEFRSLRWIAADVRARGELISGPTVRPHRFTFNTDCPGGQTMNAWPQVAKCFSAPIVNPQPPHAHHPTLAAGAYGPPVTQLQHELVVGAGAHLTVDGSFGPYTRQVVMGFQAFFRIAVDGIAGPQTWNMLDYCYALRGGK
jgi:hypothetical protein